MKQILIDGLDDWVQAHQVVWEIGATDDGVVAYDQEIIAKVAGAVRTLLEAGLVSVGDVPDEPDHMRFVDWGLGPEASECRIVERWGELDRLPRIWELFWLSNTARGDEVARETLAERER